MHGSSTKGWAFNLSFVLFGGSLVPRPLFFFLCGGGEKKGLMDLQYIFCAARSTTFGDR